MPLGIGERLLFDSVHVFVFGNLMWNVFSQQMWLLVVLTGFFFFFLTSQMELSGETSQLSFVFWKYV